MTCSDINEDRDVPGELQEDRRDAERYRMSEMEDCSGPSAYGGDCSPSSTSDI